MLPNNPNQAMQASPMGSDIKSLCQRYMNYHVIAQTRDGQQFEGIIDGMDDDGVTMLVPEDVDGEERQYGLDGYGRRRFRRFRRQRFPFEFLLPFFTPYPYYYQPYPYPYYPYPYYPYSPEYGYGVGY